MSKVKVEISTTRKYVIRREKREKNHSNYFFQIDSKKIVEIIQGLLFSMQNIWKRK